MTDVTELSDDELLEAIHLIPNDLVAGSGPADEWMKRSHMQRKLEKIGVSCTRQQAIQISRQILKDAEAGRIEATDREAKQGAQYEEPDCSRGLRTKFYIEATCTNCYLQHRFEVTPKYIGRYRLVAFQGALKEVESEFMAHLIETDGWVDGKRLLCKGCVERERADAE